MNKNPTFNSRPLARILFTLLLGAAAATALWTMHVTVRGQDLQTNFGNVTISKLGSRGTMGNISLLKGLNHASGLNVAASSPASQLLNISTRLRVQPGDNTMIGGFIITGTQPKTVIVRGIGPSLSSFFLGALADPVIEVYGSSAELLATNDNWKDAATKQEIIDSGIPPTNDSESALWGILNPGAYTVVVRGKNDATGIGLFEVYDLDQSVDSKLANISTRGFVDTGDNVMIGGIIVGPTGAGSSKILVRAIGPSLSNFGIQNALADPMLDLYDSNGNIIASNDDWKQSQPAIQSTGIPPQNDKESATLSTLSPGNYTAIVRGKSVTGIGLVEVYDLTPKTLEQVSQVISASQGGTITLPGGSSVSIPPGVLENDQLVTLSLLSSLPDQPPSGIVTSVGPALSVSLISKPGSSGNIQFLLNYGSASIPGVTGSATIAELVSNSPGAVVRLGSSTSRTDFVDLNDGNMFVGIPGNYDAAVNSTTVLLNSDLASNAGTINISLGNVSEAAKSAPPPVAGGVMWDPTFQDWVTVNPQLFDHTKRTALLVHGFFSTAQKAFSGLSGPCVEAIMRAGGYEQVVGFNYDSMDFGGVQQNGQQLASFIQSLGLTEVDIIAHSKGGPVALAGGCAAMGVNINHMVLLGSPLMGSPIADSVQGQLTYLMNARAHDGLVPRILSASIGLLLNTSWAQDFQTSGATMTNLRSCFDSTHPETKLVLAGGTNPVHSSNSLELTLGAAMALLKIFNEPFDMLVGKSSSLADNWPRANIVRSSFDLSHTELQCDPQVIAFEAQNLDGPLPSIMVTPTTLGFSATEGGFAPPNQSLTIKNVGAAGSTLNHAVTKNASWVGLSGSTVPLAAGESTSYTISVNTSGLSAANSPYTATIAVSDPASANTPQNVMVTLTLNPNAASVFTGPFSGSGPFANTNNDCTFQVNLSGNITITESQMNGTTQRSAEVDGSWSNSVTGGSDCIAGGAPFDYTISVTGPSSNLAFSGGDFPVVTFQGSPNGNAITGTATFTYPGTTGSISSPVTLSRQP